MTAITIEFDPDKLRGYTDEYLAMLWHLAQHNPADGVPAGFCRFRK